jgi:hypothetical protein
LAVKSASLRESVKEHNSPIELPRAAAQVGVLLERNDARNGAGYLIKIEGFADDAGDKI